MDVTCVVNAHREGYLVHATLGSVRAARRRAEACGIRTRTLVVLDRADEITAGVVARSVAPDTAVLETDHGDLAAARNAAVGAIDTAYTAFVDGDDLWGASWLLDACVAASAAGDDAVLHPEYNVYFGGAEDYVFRHVDSESPRFVFEHLLRENYWTALSLSRTDLYRRFPYRPNTIRDGFGYEDWTWNVETLRAGVTHRIVPDCTHFIRRGKPGTSLLELTNSGGAVPRVLEMYRRSGPRPARARTRRPTPGA